MVGSGEQVGGVRLWAETREPRTISELLGDRAGLFLFYLFDWSST